MDAEIANEVILGLAQCQHDRVFPTFVGLPSISVAQRDWDDKYSQVHDDAEEEELQKEFSDMLMPYLQGMWQAIEAPGLEPPSTFALTLFRGNGTSPTWEQIQDNPEEQRVVILERYNTLIDVFLGNIRLYFEHAKLLYFQPDTAKETTVTSSGELRCVPKGPTDLQDQTLRWFNRIADHLRGYRNILLELVQFLWRQRADAIVSRQQAEDQMCVSLPVEVSKDDYTRVLLYIVEQAHKRGFARYGDFCYEQHVLPAHRANDAGQSTTAPSIYTGFWKQTHEIKDFIFEMCDRWEHEWMWRLMNSQGSGKFMDRMLTYFQGSQDTAFPKLDRKKMRAVYSFRDGVYVAKDDRFYLYGEVPIGTSSCRFIDLRFLADDWEGGRVPIRATDDDVARVHDPEDAEFAFHHLPWNELATPKLETILTSQHLSEEVRAWVYVFLGRLLYATGKKDRWQVMLYLQGVAGSGKSTLGLLVKMFFDASDVGVLSNNAQTQFALADLYTKLIVLCFEVKHNFRLDQAELQSMISGEQLSLARKCKTAITMEWDIPLFFVGNEPPPVENASGSISRRMVRIKFDHKPQNSDPNLLSDLKKELPRIILKCNQAYLSAVHCFGKKDIWDVLPEYFKEQQTAMKESTSPLVTYLNQCAELEYDPSYYVTLDDMGKHFREYLKTSGWRSTQWREELWQTAFQERCPPLEVVKAKEIPYKGKVLKDVKIVRGVKIDSGCDGYFAAAPMPLEA